jgi:hypothetical protein
MDPRIFVSRKAYESDLACFTGVDQGRIRSLRIKNAMRIFKPENLVVLNQIDPFDAEPPERFIQLPRGFLSRSPVDLGHEKTLFAISIAQCFPHPGFAGAVIVIPGIVEEIDSSIYRSPDDSNSEVLIDIWKSEVPSTKSDRGDLLASAAQISENHCLPQLTADTFRLNPFNLVGNDIRRGTLCLMNGVRWGFTFLMGNSLMSDEDKLDLVTKATLLYLKGEERTEVSGDGYEGVLFTNREWKVVGGFSGQQFDAILESELDKDKLRLRFLVSEQTLQQGTAYSPN